MAGEVSPLLQDLAVVLAVAAATTILFNRLRQPVVLGYLLAGVIVGPHTPPFAFVSDQDTIGTLGDLGVIFLLFALGLEFNLRKLRKVGATALVSGTLQVALMLWVGYVVGRVFGLEPLGAVFLGAIVSISSTVIIVKVVTELRQQDQEWAQVVFGILIVEDILAVLMLTLLSAAGGAESLAPAAVGRLLATFAFFIATALVVGLLVVPRLVAFVARLGVEEVLVVTTIALGFGLAILGGLLGFSPALGAFVMGALIAESPAHRLVEERVAPVRDLFTAIFFVTVGMLVDPRALVAHWPLILTVTLAVIGGKVVAASFATFLTGRDVGTSLRVGFGLAQVGEFSFILAALAVAVGATDAPLYAVAVSAAGVTAFTTPYLIRAAPRAARAFERLAPRPLLTYAHLYGAWTRRLREPAVRDDPVRRRETTGVAARAILFGAVAISVVAAGGASVSFLGAQAAQRTGLHGAALVLGWLAVGLAALPFVLLYVRAQRAFAEALADAALPARAPDPANAAVVRKVLVRTFFLGGLVVASALLLVFASPFVPTGPILAVVVVGLVAAAFVLYRALARFQATVDAALGSVLGDEAPGGPGRLGAPGASREVLQLIREEYPWAVSAREVTLPGRPVTTPLTIRRLHLRGRTGASIVAIHRHGEAIFNPPPDTPLLPGDRVVLLGDEEQVEAASDVLLHEGVEEGSPRPAAPMPGELRVPPGSAFVDRSLAALRLPDKAGVTVLGIQRAATRIPNPPPETRLEAGDVLIVLGTKEQIEKAEALAAQRNSS